MIVNLLRLDLHTNLELLKPEVYRNIREMAPFSNGTLIFYGICRNILRNLEEDLQTLDALFTF